MIWFLVFYAITYGLFVMYVAVKAATTSKDQSVSLVDASWVLNCSTEYVEALLVNGELKLTTKDLVRYTVARNQERHQALRELVQESERLGLYDNEI